MKITKRQLRRLIRESILIERGEARVDQIKKYESEIREWVETLVDSMGDHVSIKIREMDSRRYQRVVDALTKAVILEMITMFGHPVNQDTTDREQKEKWRKEKQKKADAFTSSVPYGRAKW